MSISNETQQLLPLPYAPIEVANRDMVRQSSLRGGRETVYVLFENIIIREEANGDRFNVRKKPAAMSWEEWLKVLDIEALANNILLNGMERPIEGLFNTAGKLVLLDGERRYLAIGWLLEHGHNTQKNGKPMNYVEVIQAPKELTEDGWILRMLNSNDNLKYQPIEIAEGMLRLKKSFGYSNESIAKQLHKSRQYIDNMVALAEEPDSIKDAVASGGLKATVTHELRRKIPDAEEREQFVKDKLGAGEEIKVRDAQLLPSVNEKKEGDEEDGQVPREETFIAPAGTTKVETSSALKVEEESHKTSAKTPVVAPRTQRDALPPVDWSADKTEAELNLNEVMKLLDKLETKFSYLPAHLKQYRDEYSGLVGFIKGKITKTVELVKKAPVKAEEE